MPDQPHSAILFLAIAAGAFLLGAMFAWLWWRFRGAVLLTATTLWLGYALWEGVVQWRRTPQADIRMDLLLIYPALLIVTTIAMLALRRRARGMS